MKQLTQVLSHQGPRQAWLVLEMEGQNWKLRRRPTFTQHRCTQEAMFLSALRASKRIKRKKHGFENLLGWNSLTKKQQEAGRLAWVYRLSRTEIARRLGVHRKTVDDHLSAGQRKLDQARQHKRTNRPLKNDRDEHERGLGPG